MFGTGRASRTAYQAVAAVLLAVIAADTVGWSIACQRLEAGARAAASASGWTLSAGATRWRGWPDAAEIILPDSVLRTGPDIIPPLTWTAPRAGLRLSAWHPQTLTAWASGAQTLIIGAAPALPFTARTLEATIDLTARDPVRIAATDLDVTAPNGPVRVASAGLLLLPAALSGTLSGISLTGRAGQPVTPPIDTLTLQGRITPAIEPQPSAIESARRWRARDGKLELSAVSLRWASLDATAAATLTLDPALQPALTGTVTATGLGAIVEQLAQTGALTRSSATAIQAVLVILAAPAAGGPVTLPVTLRDGVLTVARIPLLRFAPLAWE